MGCGERPAQEDVQEAIERCESVYHEMNYGALGGLVATSLYVIPTLGLAPTLFSLAPVLVGFVGAEALYRIGQINHNFATELQRNYPSALETA